MRDESLCRNDLLEAGCRAVQASQTVSIHAAPLTTELAMTWLSIIQCVTCFLSTDAGINRLPRGRFERLMNLLP